MNIVHSLEEIKSTINENQLTLLYISRDNCSVCHSLLPQVERVLENYPSVVSIHADADEIPAIAGEYSIFTVPVVIVFAAGKEMIRKARFVPIEELNAQISRLVTLIND
ncbi:thioredoxin family protein [Bacillus aquiflavi]|uniref:Thioredoxin family protein n=1 Tax=Bacillus aquiflavi TaxID=2672567 RepID=A0A6B3VZI0_9BACI|nr:thioredoxin family protein [Bacillus aquiflavi]MBA4536786.1 thioredoxin family protein [Bacillus aquiflavi]NEY81153.1 thioredoxin family protein [Bacillus aquiflavi]UAC49714.1 thioredoxin family protein [Bacillus aquiflavi]